MNSTKRQVRDEVGNNCFITITEESFTLEMNRVFMWPLVITARIASVINAEIR